MSESTNNLLSKYLNQYQKNPRSRVFAPLAEAYRKIGMIDDALSTIRDGLKYHPDYQLAYLVLGNCYSDLSDYGKAYDVLKPMVGANSDNLKLHKLFGKICQKLNYDEEALESYKTVLFINPYDEKTAQLVSRLEESEEMKSKYEVIRENSNIVPSDSGDDEDWVAIDLSINEEKADKFVEGQPLTEEEELDNWAMNKDNLVAKKEKEKEKKLLPKDDFEEDAQEEIDVEGILDGKEEPFVTHTLVDIYIAQKHFPKAKQLLEQILENDPNDLKSRKKLNKILGKLGDQSDTYYKKVEGKYMEFLARIKARSKVYTSA